MIPIRFRSDSDAGARFSSGASIVSLNNSCCPSPGCSSRRSGDGYKTRPRTPFARRAWDFQEAGAFRILRRPLSRHLVCGAPTSVFTSAVELRAASNGAAFAERIRIAAASNVPRVFVVAREAQDLPPLGPLAVTSRRVDAPKRPEERSGKGFPPPSGLEENKIEGWRGG